MNLKSFAVAAALVVASATASFAGPVDDWNARINTPAAKAALLKSKCASANGADLFLCDRWKKTGVPDSDVRIGLVAAGIVAGGAAGLVAQSVPFAALGNKTLIEYWGVTTIAGTAATLPVVGATGALIGGAVVGAGVLATR